MAAREDRPPYWCWRRRRVPARPAAPHRRAPRPPSQLEPRRHHARPHPVRGGRHAPTTVIPPQPDAAPGAPAAPKKRASPLIAGLLGLALGAGIVGGIWAVTANNEPDTETFTLKGTFTLTEKVYNDPAGERCRGSADSGYDDIAGGTSVTVYGPANEVIATGNLGASEGDEYGVTCTFKIAVAGVPKGEKFYKVEVSHRGTVQLTAEQAENGELAASLG